MVAEPLVAPNPTSVFDIETPEMIHGQFIDFEMNKLIYRRIIGRLFYLIETFNRKNECGEVFDEADIILNEKDKPRPDIVFVSNKNKHLIGDYINGAPNLVIEVVSDNSYLRDAESKKDLYEKYGVEEYWLVLPHIKTIIVYRLIDEKYKVHSFALESGVVHSSVLSGFSLDLNEVF